jgi:hypothetical protein|tara:strand:- start:280 stop:540 length:261 start_codon:yes stop_codon:yes gene_type:complete
VSKKNLLSLQKKIKDMEKDNKISDYVDGLYVKNGRLINARPDGMTGIAKASMYRAQMKKQYKIDCIADGIERAKMRMDGDKNMYDY